MTPGVCFFKLYFYVKINIIYIKKVVPIPVNLSKLSDIVKNEVAKKDVYNATIKVLKIKYLILLT